MRIQITILREIEDTLDGERLYELVKERLNDLLDLKFGASMHQQITESSEPPG